MSKESYAQVKRTIGALASAVRSGESWSKQLQSEYDEGLRALDAGYEAQTRLAQVIGWGDFSQCSPAQQEQFAAWAQEVGLPHLGNPHIRKELFS